VVNDVSTVVDAVAESLGQPVLLCGVLDIDVYRLHRTDPWPDLVARVFGSGVARETVDVAGRVLQGLAGTRFPAERCPIDCPVLAIGDDLHSGRGPDDQPIRRRSRPRSCLTSMMASLPWGTALAEAATVFAWW
jgi:hypothetical protein